MSLICGGQIEVEVLVVTLSISGLISARARLLFLSSFHCSCIQHQSSYVLFFIPCMLFKRIRGWHTGAPAWPYLRTKLTSLQTYRRFTLQSQTEAQASPATEYQSVGSVYQTAPRTCCLPAGILVDRHELVSYCVSSASFTPWTAAQNPDRPHPANLTMLYRNGTSMDSPSQSTFGSRSGIDRSQSTTIFAGGCSLCYLDPCIRRDLEAKSNALQRLLQNVPLS